MHDKAGALREDHVQTVPGKAQVFINNGQMADQEVGEEMAQVLFDDREIVPAVWVPMESTRQVLRKGKNGIRIEFQPSDPKAPYLAQLSWASVMDQGTEEETGGPKVLVQCKGGALYDPGGPKAFERIKGDEPYICVGWAHFIAHSPHLAFVHTPAGARELVY
jgi:hypothetical protein